MRSIHPKSDKPSLTQQQFVHVSDINNIVAGMKKGIMPKVQVVQPQYGDVSSIDYLAMLNSVADVDNVFSRLPAKLRVQFHNSPQQMLRWVENPANREKAIKMGLLREVEQGPDYQAIMEGKDVPPVVAKADDEANPDYKKHANKKEAKAD